MSVYTPRVVDHRLEGAIGQVDADLPPERVVGHHRRDAPFHEVVVVLVLVRRREEGFVLLDGVALVVDDRPAGPDPSRVGLGELEDGLRLARPVRGGLISPGGVNLGSGDNIGRQRAGPPDSRSARITSCAEGISLGGTVGMSSPGFAMYRDW